MVKRLIDIVSSNYENIVIGSSILGANVGTYVAAKQNSDYLFGMCSGAIGGMVIGVVSPVLLPGVVLGAPGYAISKLHSSLQGSQQKAGTRVIHPDSLSEMKEGMRG
jgi:hypothetical protein